MRRPMLLLGWLALVAPLPLSGCGGDVAPLGPPTTLPSGVVVEELRRGTGAELVDGKWFALHYDARIAAIGDGPGEAAPYDSTRSGEPLVAKLGHSILMPGFADGIRGLREGGIRRCLLPPATALGEIGRHHVPPNATLEYTVELVAVFQSTASGLNYRVVDAGSGEPPRDGQVVAFEHRSWQLETGRELTRSDGVAQPLSFIVGRGSALPGLEEAARLMKPGARWQLAIPPKLGYGEAGVGFKVLPDQELLFDLRLMRVKDP